ncbi:MAG: adenosylcobinamide-GDP ribazoletransferase [Solirubrobacteraceae bacterium]|jgi:adenosylcobinamide-GDP ribazoletransferase|nr:adenosylcobinamide-GDP ribazoletransferase [Solirubrobacteraceae bacterium]
MSARAPDGDTATAPARGVLDGVALALAFLTVIPIRLRGDGRELGSAAVWFPLVGALVGGLAGATRFYAEPLLGAAVASILALAVLVAVTGALHEDGLADCADGLGVRGDRECRLAVMRDPAIGVFGTLALLGWALLLAAALAQLSNAEALRALVSAAIVGRWAALLHAVMTPPARPDGLGATFRVATVPVVVAGVVTVASCVLLDGVVAGLVAAAAGALVALATSAWSSTTLGGRTGDTLGATIAVAEVAVCLTLLGFAAA